MDKDLLKSQITEILPDHEEDSYNFTDQSDLQEELTEQKVTDMEGHMNAAALARLKAQEKRAQEKLEKRKNNPTFGMNKQELAKYNKEQARIEENLAEIELVQASPAAQNFLSGGFSDMTPYAGTTPREVVKLLESLNINLSLNLTKKDTYNLLGCLLTCNEAQLYALMSNSRVPVAIKTIIKRLLDDAKLGNIDTVEKLWDRIFGKADQAMLNMPIQGIPTQSGIIPNTVVSREAYTIIRDTIIGN